MSFRVGQQVVCIDDGNSRGMRWPPGCAPVKGRIYTVRQIGLRVSGQHGIRLEELINANDRPYRRSRFRPLVTQKKKTDISIFKKILDEAKRETENVV